MKKIGRIIIWLAVVLIILLNALNLYFSWHKLQYENQNNDKYEKMISYIDEVNSKYNDKISVLESEVSNLKSQVPKDGVDGKNGVNGKDSISSHTIEQKVIEKQVIKEVPIKPEDGLTPLIRCNTIANRWEQRYSIQDNWQLLNNELVKCTILP